MHSRPLEVLRRAGPDPRPLKRLCLVVVLIAGVACRPGPSHTEDGGTGRVQAAASTAPSAITPSTDETAATRDDTTLVVAFSFTGRTATVGEEFAAMLGARLRLLPAPPDGSGKPGPLPVEGVRRLLLGFPIRTGAPAAEVLAAVAVTRFDGLEVLPFYTYLHHVEPAALAALSNAITARGGRVHAPLGFRVPLATTAETLRREVSSALVRRVDVFPASPSVEKRCAPRGPVESIACDVPEGEVWVGDTGVDAPAGAPWPRRVRVPAFALDRSEVTVAAYRRCEAAGACPPIRFDASTFCTAMVAESDQVPVPCAGSSEAAAYCAWAGGRVPREDEWLRAARGEKPGVFVWGDASPTTDPTPRGNLGEPPATGHATYAVVPPGAPWPSDGAPLLARGCSFPAGDGQFGHCDLTGNLSEWVRVGERWVLKGGSWLDGEASSFRLGARGVVSLAGEAKVAGFYLTGFRCAYERVR